MSIIQGLISGVVNTYTEKDRPDPGTGEYATTHTGVGSQGTPYDPGYATTTVSNGTMGLWRRHFVGNWNSGSAISDINFFNTHGSIYGLADTYVSFGAVDIPDQSNYAFEWVGYIQAPSTDTFNFAIDADDYAKMWIGSTAISGYNESNNLFTGISNSVGYNKNSVQLIAGKWYPVRIWFQEIAGGERMQLFGGVVGATMTSMSQWNTAYNSVTSGFNPPTYTLASAGNATTVDEGVALTFNVTTTNFGTGTLYWTTGSTGGYAIDAGRFSPGATGSVSIVDDAGSFTVTVSADSFTATGVESYNIVLATSLSPMATVGNTVSITVNDTSQTPTMHGSVPFNGTSQWFDVGTRVITTTATMSSGNAAGLGTPPGVDGTYVYCANSALAIPVGASLFVDGQNCTVVEVRSVADNLIFVGFTPRVTPGVINSGDTLFFIVDQTQFNLGSTWTIEYYSKANGASGSTPQTVMSQSDNLGIDIYYQDGNLRFQNGTIVVPEPTPTAWTHVAIVNNASTVNVYYDGVAQAGTKNNTLLNYISNRLAIGMRGYDAGGGAHQYQWFNGKITNIRITNTAVYTSSFIPTVLPTKISGTKFLWAPTNYGITTDSSDLALPMTNNNSLSYDSDYPIEQAYELSVLGSTPLIASRSINGQLIGVKSTNFDGSPTSGSYISVNGTTIASDVSIGTGYLMSRGHTLAVINQYTGETISIQAYDTYGNSGDRTAFASALAGVATGRIIAIGTYDADMIDTAIRNNLQNYYGSTTVATWAPSRRSHLFIGVRR